MNDEIMVSVCCLVYNHEKYLRQCLDGFMMQKTNFKFEVLIHDDASTDGSPDIIREYEKKYPDIIKPIFQKENQHSKGVRISWIYQYPRAKGKYIALCEGDDFWIDENKLQVQYDALEKNKNCVFCTSKVQIISESGEEINQVYPNENYTSSLINGQDIISTLISDNLYPFQTSSYFFISTVISDLFFQMPEYYKKFKVGDTPLMLLYATKGSFYYIDKIMSCYRRNSDYSFSKKYDSNTSYKISVICAKIDALKEYDRFTDNKYTDAIQLRCLCEEYRCLNLKKDYKAMLDRKYRICAKKQPFKERVYIRFFALFPRFESIYQRIRGKNK